MYGNNYYNDDYDNGNNDNDGIDEISHNLSQNCSTIIKCYFKINI